MRSLKYLKLVIISIFINSFLFLPNFIFSEENLADTCKMEVIESKCNSIGKDECRKILEKCEKFYQDESDRIEKDLNKTTAEKKTLQNKIYTLNQKIKNLNYQISQSNLVISDLKIQIEDTSSTIDNTVFKIEENKQRLSEIIRTINQENKKSLIEVLFAENDLSDFFSNLTALEQLNYRGQKTLAEIKILKFNLEKEKESLDGEKGDLEKTVKMQTLQKIENDKTKKEQEQTLKLTEAEYQKQLKQKEEVAKKAGEIRARIFELFGVAKAPTFGEALEIAKYASGLTGIRPAFLLAILTQESNIGKNVGQCYLSNFDTGSGKSIKTGAIVAKVMNPKRDVQPFLDITRLLGRDSLATAVSCPMSFGWGGAMGPAQFIPSTWKLFETKIKNATGKVGDPWDIKDAFVAAAIYLSDRGASAKTTDSERKAALAYFSGSTTNTKYLFYANSVLKIASQYEQDIKDIEAANGNK